MRYARVLVFALVAGCSSKGSGDNVNVDVTGMQGVPIPANGALDILLVDVAANGAPGTVVIDTGSPIVVLDPSVFASAGLPDGAGTVDTLTLGPLTFAKPPVVGENLLASPDPSIPVGGSLGCGVLCAFVVSLDYRASAVTFGSSPPPANLANAASLSFSLAGGGTASLTGVPGSVDLPPSRIVLATTVEGHAYSFLLDTGSSLVLLRQTIFTGLIADGRAEIDGLSTATAGPTSSSSVTRVRSFVVGGAEVDGLVAASDPSLEATLDSVASETGKDVDGLIGGSFLRDYYVTVDYPGGQLTLRRYATGGPTFDAFDRVGVAVAPASGSIADEATVAQVFAATDAATQGVVAGDAIVSIDGQRLSMLGQTAINALLSGPVGSMKTIEFGLASSPALSTKTVSMQVDDVLPL